MDISHLTLNYYSFGYSGGLISDPNRLEPALGLSALVRIAQGHGLGGVEFPFDKLFRFDHIDDGARHLESILNQGMSVFVDLESFDLHYIRRLLPALKPLGVDSIRVKMAQMGKTIYGGNRHLSKYFSESLQSFREDIRRVLPDLESAGISLAIENHQDLNSIELVELSESLSKDLVGITWDVGNSLAVGDTVESFYANAGHLIKNIHLKDYKIAKYSEGIRLVRCVLGEGVVDFAEVFSRNPPGSVNMSLELGAQITRTCEIGKKAYWEALSHVVPDESEYVQHVESLAVGDVLASEYEKGKRGKALIAHEELEVKLSVDNMRKILDESV